MCIITLRKSTANDSDFVNYLTRRVMKEYVDATWNGSEEKERYYSLNKCNPSTTRIIQCGGEDIGRVTVTYSTDCITLEGIHISETFQGKGIGSRLVKQIIDEATDMRLPLELILLKANPVKELYERIGFHTYKEDVYRFYMRLFT